MHEFKGKILYLSAVVLLVIVILLSNLGQDFKYDIYSYTDTMNYKGALDNHWFKSNLRQNYIDQSSKYILNYLKANNLKPFLENKYSEEWEENVPCFNTLSSLEIVDKAGRVIKKYAYGRDFFEDFKGIYTPGDVQGKTSFIQDIESNPRWLSKVVLYPGYRYKSSSEIISIDKNLLSSGAYGVISPSPYADLINTSKVYSKNSETTGKGLVKFIVTQNIFEDIKNLTSKGYIVRMKCGASIEKVMFRNIYALLEGKNTSYKPLFIAIFYDGIHKFPDSKDDSFQRYSTPPAVLLESLNCLKLQRLKKPDRSIVFCFLSGYAEDKKGLEFLLSKNFPGDYIILDGLGTGSKNIIYNNKSTKSFSNTIENFMRKSKLSIVSKNISSQYRDNVVYLMASDYYESSDLDYSTVISSGQFLLEFIGNECYNLDFLSGNIREIRIIKIFIRNNTLALSAGTFLLLIFTVFKNQK